MYILFFLSINYASLISRRTNYDILEIIDHSLDINLTGNQVRYKFQDAPILNGITIHERGSIVVMLVPTVSCVHRLTFLHPSFEVIIVRSFRYVSCGISFIDFFSIYRNPTSHVCHPYFRTCLQTA